MVTGHIVAVIAAHDKALRLLPAGHQLTGQLTMMLVMVGYTFTGLYLRIVSRWGARAACCPPSGAGRRNCR
ncbi:hypothetical protein B1T45_01395 [Mycobacterium kansasii]|nr:hypothetical protein B1T43_01390 [Mycobacterium kansasii]ARG60189.1 hypothetical protein B1T45_01395 [Mycobacterium kansasii]ARG67925.1 hypothetical protein B1T47_01490 [Mycobacterium kansasii]ARG77562.1 hypothetical protein B1T51_27330 [Mycobacterium kansasii]ARG83048.1 hypothetical protein B1T52_27430 [Mycobacterium kansasii]